MEWKEFLPVTLHKQFKDSSGMLPVYRMKSEGRKDAGVKCEIWSTARGSCEHEKYVRCMRNDQIVSDAPPIRQPHGGSWAL